MAQELVSAEMELLQSTLNGERNHVLGILDGLSDDDLRRPMLPSGWSCLGLVNHLAVDVERFWFSQVTAGQPMDAGESADDAWQVAADVPAAEVIGRYRRELGRAESVVRSTTLDVAHRWWREELFVSWRLNRICVFIVPVTTE